MKWTSTEIKPTFEKDTKVLLARFEEGSLVNIVPGLWWAKDKFFSPNRAIAYTHWMPYTEYWDAMNKVPRE